MSDNAAIRNNYVDYIYETGVQKRKKAVLRAIPADMMDLHKKGYIHIHDMEAFGLVYNCCIPDVYNFIKHQKCSAHTIAGKILFLFSQYKLLITRLGVSQSGGIGFANFDQEISDFLTQLHIPFNAETQAIFSDAVNDFLFWINTTRTRYNREPYYISINLGLSTDAWGRYATLAILTQFLSQPVAFTRPNIIFKVSNKINAVAGTANNDLFLLALKVTSQRMIPTYLLLDSDVNCDCDAEQLAIMGCRTRVYQNANGKESSVGRGNIAYISINLPRLALENRTLSSFNSALDSLLENVIKLLKIRAESFRKHGMVDFVFKSGVWHDAISIDELIKQGTLSVGFIGLAETIQILTGQKMFTSSQNIDLGYEIISRMRKCIDDHRTNESLNFSLLATPGEMLSGRFCAIDKVLFNDNVHQKDFYTNSFHIDVDSRIPLLTKIEIEGRFHQLCNGGAITYVEFKESPFNNLLALQDAIEFAQKKGVSYFGFNYPLDICEECSMVGTFDQCPQCASKKIKHIRRVSGYLEDTNFFTQGKSAEVKLRCPNI